MITREQVKKIYENNGEFSFEMAVYWEDCNVNYMNELLDEQVEDGHLLEGIDYDPIGVDNGEIKFLVTVEDMTGYFEEESEED